MTYNRFLKKRYKPDLYTLEPSASGIGFKRRTLLARLIHRLLFGSPGQATPKYRIVSYDYSPKHGLTPQSRAPFHSKVVTAGVVAAGLSIVWSLTEPSIAFYEPPAPSSQANKLVSPPEARSELNRFATQNAAFQEQLALTLPAPVEHAPQQAAAAPETPAGEEAPEAAQVSLGLPFLNPISPEEVLEAFSYPSNPLIETLPGTGDSPALAVIVPGESLAGQELVPELPSVADAAAGMPPQLVQGWQTLTVKAGDNLSVIFDYYGLSRNDLHALLELKEAKTPLRRLQVGQEIQIEIGEGNRVIGLNLPVSATEELHIARLEGQDGFSAKVQALDLETRLVSASGRISASLYSDGRKAGMNDKLIQQMVKIFGWDIDFALDLQPGDRFVVIYEELYHGEEKIQTGVIKAAEFINSGSIYRAVRYSDETGHASYYTPGGEGMEKAFLRTPINVVNITSGFNLNRLHPILNKVRAHNGVDYGAPTGTPVYASGSGKVTSIGWKNGYGKTIVLDHGDKYQTVYAHLSKFEDGVKAGERVHQGDLIGYVGSTGLATGPHLHYEFLVDGEHKDPLTQTLPQGNAVAAEEKADFLAQTQPLVAQLNQLSNVAQAERLAETIQTP